MQGAPIPKQFNKNKRCYYCGAPPPSSKEHAPAKAIFEAFSCDSITVPACNDHNSARNLDDRAIVSFFLRGLEYGFRSGSLTPNQITAYKKAVEKLGHASEVNSHDMQWDPTGTLHGRLVHIDQTDRVHGWMRQLTAAIVWSALGGFDKDCKWDQAVVWSPEYLEAEPALASLLTTGDKLLELQDRKASLLSRSLHWWRGWSASPRPYPPDIYRFEISFAPSEDLKAGGDDYDVMFRHWFYGQFSWYVYFETSPNTKRALRRAVEN